MKFQLPVGEINFVARSGKTYARDFNGAITITTAADAADAIACGLISLSNVSTPIPPVLLPYGSSDPSVVYRSSLTSLDAIKYPDVGGYVPVTAEGTGQVFDAVLGLKPTAGDYYFNTPNAASLMNQGQIYFEVETKLLSVANNSSNGSSGGIGQSGNEYVITFGTLTPVNGNSYNAVNINTATPYMTLGWDTANNTAALAPINDGKSKQFTSFVYAWNGLQAWLFMDGILAATVTALVAPTTNHYERVYLGRYSGGGIYLTSGYLRNLQISNKAPVFLVPPMLAKVGIFGDSYANTTYNGVTSSAFNLDTYMTLNKVLASHGLAVGGNAGQQSHGGATILGNAASNGGNNLTAYRAALTAANPTYVIFQAGHNDMAQAAAQNSAPVINTSALTAKMQEHIQFMFGLNGFPATTVQGMQINSTPWPSQYGLSSTVVDAAGALLWQPDHQAVHDVMAALPAWFDATYPLLAGSVWFNDCFADFGGFSYPNVMNFGVDTNVSTDLLHPTPYGQYTMGKSWANGIIKHLGYTP